MQTFNNIGRFILLSIIFFVPLTPVLSVFSYDYNGHDLARAFQVLVGIVTALVIMVSKNRSHVEVFAEKFIWIIPIFIIGITSSAASNSPSNAIREVCLWISFSAVICLLSAQSKMLGAALKWSILGSTTYGLIILSIILLDILNGRNHQVENIPIGYINYRFYNHTQTIIIPLCLIGMMFFPKSSLMWSISKWCCAFNLALLLVTVGRGTIVGLAGAAIMVGFLYRESAIPILRRLLVGIGIGLIGFFVLFFLIPYLLAGSTALEPAFYAPRTGSIGSRFYLWDLAKSMALERPFLGAGPMHFANTPNGDAAHPHNLILQMASEWGLPATLILLIMIIAFLRKLHYLIANCRTAEMKAVGIGTQMLVMAIIIDSMFSGVLVMPTSQMLGSVGIAISIMWMSEANKLTTPVLDNELLRYATPLSLSTVFISQIYLCITVITEFFELPTYLMYVMDNFPNPVLSPRFWSVGWF